MNLWTLNYNDILDSQNMESVFKNMSSVCLSINCAWCIFFYLIKCQMFECCRSFPLFSLYRTSIIKNLKEQNQSIDSNEHNQNFIDYMLMSIANNFHRSHFNLNKIFSLLKFESLLSHRWVTLKHKLMSLPLMFEVRL